MNTKNEIAIFDNEEFGQVRVMGTPENPWFVASDVATALGYKNTRKAIIDHVDEEDKNTVTIRDGIGNPNKVTINESGVYALIMGSKLERAKKFKRWVTSEVLPAIRKQGYYGISHELTDAVKQLTDQYGTICNAIEFMAKTQQQTNEVLSMVADTVKIMAHHIMKPQPTTINLQPNQNQTTKPSTKPKPNHKAFNQTNRYEKRRVHSHRDMRYAWIYLRTVVKQRADEKRHNTTREQRCNAHTRIREQQHSGN